MIENREYSKKELARLYSPNTKKVKSAMKNLRDRNRNSYTARQVRLIAEYLCLD